MQYVEAREARAMPGLRLALSIGVPGPWGESAKKIFEYKKIAYVPVAQHPAQPNEDLKAWTGIRNAPVAILDDQPPKSNWSDILALAERLKPEPALLPAASEDRATSQGISAEICAEGGLGWTRRLLLMERAETVNKGWGTVLQHEYGHRDSLAAAQRRVADIMAMLAARLCAQKARGSDFFVGHAIMACDIHWACFSQIVLPLPQEVNPMPKYLRASYGAISETERAALDPILIEHRDRIFERYLGLPLDY